MSSRRVPAYPQSIITAIMELFRVGHGSDAISLKLRMPATHVRRVLQEHGLHRSPSEARAIRKLNGIPYYVRNGQEEERLPSQPRSPRQPRMSLFDAIETEGGLSPADLERALKL